MFGLGSTTLRNCRALLVRHEMYIGVANRLCLFKVTSPQRIAFVVQTHCTDQSTLFFTLQFTLAYLPTRNHSSNEPYWPDSGLSLQRHTLVDIIRI